MELKRGMVRFFKIRNRRGHAALYKDYLTEGRTADQAFARMLKAVRRKRSR